MWSNLFTIQISVLEKILRTVLVYGGVAVLLRLAGKRDLAQLNTFDLVVVLLLSNVVQNAIIGPDTSLDGGLLGAVVLIAINAVWVRVVNRHPRMTRIFEGTATTLVRNGKITGNLHRLGLRRADVVTALRHQGADSVAEVEQASLEPGGSIVVDLKPDAQDLTVGEYRTDQERMIAELHAEIRRLTEHVDTGFARLQAGG
jgi:uncharacterized membrane protein YcaP (DUF421 family)